MYLFKSGTYYITDCTVYGGTGTAKAVLRLGYLDRFLTEAGDVYRLSRLQTGFQTHPNLHH
jgi:hypothetical protein